MHAESRLKLLHLGMGWFPDEPGGLNRYFRGLVEELGAGGADVRAVVVGPALDAPPFVTAAAERRDPLLRRVRAFAREAARAGGDADLVHAHFALYASAPVVLGRLRRKPLVVQFQGPWADEAISAGRASGAGAAVRRALERAVYRRARAHVTLSQAFRRVLVERYRVTPWNVSVIAPGVDLERYEPGDRRRAREGLGLDDSTFAAVAVRRLVPRMGLGVLLEAWAQLDGKRVLFVAGDGPARVTLEEQAGRLGLGDQVRFLGRVDEEHLVELYRAADVAVVPTLELEGFGLVVLEALACGTPVVTTDAGSLPEVVAPLDESLVVPAGDAPALARRLRAPLPASDACRAYAEQFTWTRAADRQREVYRSVLSPPRDRPLRVVYVDHCAQLAGGEIALLRLLGALEGVDAHVILGEDGPFARKLTRAGISHEVLPFPLADLRRADAGAGGALRTLPYAFRLARRLRAYAPDVVHTNSLKAALYGGLAARLAGVPCVWHVRDRIATDYLPPRAVRLVRRAAKHLPAAVIANSHATLATLPPLAHSAVVASPVPATEGRGARPAGPLRVGIVGRIAPWKGQHVFLDAFARAFAKGDERAVVVGAPLFGEDEYAAELAQRADALGLDGRVEFTGFSDAPENELARLDVLVHASVVPEPFGLAVAEGLAAGIPVVAARAGGPAEMIEHDVDGLLYEPGDADALAAELLRLAGDDELRARIGATARERSGAFAPEAIAPRVRAVYDELLARRR